MQKLQWVQKRHSSALLHNMGYMFDTITLIMGYLTRKASVRPLRNITKPCHFVASTLTIKMELLKHASRMWQQGLVRPFSMLLTTGRKQFTRLFSQLLWNIIVTSPMRSWPVIPHLFGVVERSFLWLPMIILRSLASPALKSKQIWTIVTPLAAQYMFWNHPFNPRSLRTNGQTVLVTESSSVTPLITPLPFILF